MDTLCGTSQTTHTQSVPALPPPLRNSPSHVLFPLSHMLGTIGTRLTTSPSTLPTPLPRMLPGPAAPSPVTLTFAVPYPAAQTQPLPHLPPLPLLSPPWPPLHPRIVGMALPPLHTPIAAPTHPSPRL
ncbi:hypothetical protein HBI84_250270 [Parastagonospora nodorum]|nr:hypothetical protein HBI84_250270 [Parastagonospora nodorum]